jgi:hypothetical protein
MTFWLRGLVTSHAQPFIAPTEARPARGVLASWVGMTPHQRADDFTTKSRITLRDAVFVAMGIAGMWGAQLATQYGMRSDVRDLGTKFDGFVQQQNATTASLQTQINEWRAETKLNRERSSDQERALSELRGFLVGAGLIKGTK